MPRRKTTDGPALELHCKVRIVVGAAMLHCAARTAPAWETGADGTRQLVADWIDDPAYGDTIVSIDWSKVIAVSYRWSE